MSTRGSDLRIMKNGGTSSPISSSKSSPKIEKNGGTISPMSTSGSSQHFEGKAISRREETMLRNSISRQTQWKKWHVNSLSAMDSRDRSLLN